MEELPCLYGCWVSKTAVLEKRVVCFLGNSGEKCRTKCKILVKVVEKLKFLTVYLKKMPKIC